MESNAEAEQPPQPDPPKKPAKKKKNPYFTSFDYKVLFVAVVALLVCRFGTNTKADLAPSPSSISDSVSTSVSGTVNSDPATTENFFNAASNEPSDFTITLPVSDLQDMLELEFDYGNVQFKTAPADTENATFEFKDFPPEYVEQDSPAEHQTCIRCILPSFSNVSNKPKPLLTITLPKNALNKLRLKFGTGGVDLGVMTLTDLTARLNTGNLHATSLTASNAKIELTTGSLYIDTLDCKTADIDHETGNVSIDLVRNADDFTLESSTGGNEVTLEGSPDDYNISAQCETGKLEVDGVTYKKKSYTSSSSSDRHVNITSSTSKVTVSFQN